MDIKAETEEKNNAEIKDAESVETADKAEKTLVEKTTQNDIKPDDEKTVSSKKKTDKKDEPITLKQALDEIDKAKETIDKGVKISYGKVSMDLYSKLQKQKATPDELIELLNKISDTFPDIEMKVLLSIFTELSSKGTSNPYIFAYILNACIDKLNKIGYETPEAPVLDDVIHLKSNISESFSYFLNCVNEKNKSVIEGKDKNQDIIIVNYLYLAILIRGYQNSPSHGVNLFVMMERAFVECYLSNPEKSAEKAVSLFVPKALLNKNSSSMLSSLHYLYSEYKKNCTSLEKKYEEQISENIRLKNTIKSSQEVQEQLNSEIVLLKDEIAREKIKAEEIETERKKAEDRIKFENNRFEMQSKSMKEGIVGKYKSVLGLEIEGIEDVLEYVPEQVRDAIQERLDRMRDIMDEMGNE